MRIATLLVPLAVLSSAVSATAIPRESKGDLQKIGKGICELEKALGVTSIEDFLDTSLGGAITVLDDKLDVTAIENSRGLLDCTPDKKPNKTDAKSDIEIISNGLCLIEKGLGVTDLEDLLDGLLGGLLTSLEDVLGLTYTQTKLGLTGC